VTCTSSAAAAAAAVLQEKEMMQKDMMPSFFEDCQQVGRQGLDQDEVDARPSMLLFGVQLYYPQHCISQCLQGAYAA
jgi:hypothetical protein